MPTIRPLSDLKTNLTEIAETARLTKEPVFLTEKGYGNIVVMSMEAWEQREYDLEIWRKLMESSIEAMKPGCKWMTPEEVFEPLLKKIDSYEETLTAKILPC